MPALMTYTNQLGDEIVLDDTERSFIGELYGREGCEAPALAFKEVTYADGTTEIASIELEPREMRFYFWAPVRTSGLKAKLEAVKRRLIQIGVPNSHKWGTLKIRKPDGSMSRIDCVYTGGFDEMVREYPNLVKFSLTFKASDPLFYDGFRTEVPLRTFEDGAWLHFGTRFTFGSDTHFRSSDTIHSETVELQGFRAYPAITISGPARNIMLKNETTGRLIALMPDFQLLAGETIVIETNPRTRSAVWNRFDGTQRNALKYITPESHLEWYLATGENELQYRNSDINETSVCLLSYEQGWLSAE